MKTAVIVFSLALFACRGAEHPTVETGGGADASTVPHDGASEPPSLETRACLNLHKFGCPEGDTSDAGTSCSTFMAESAAFIDAQCIAAATSKEALKACKVRCRN